MLQVRSIGVSNFGCHHLDELLEAATVPPSVNQIELHPFLAQKKIAAHCKRLGVAIQARAGRWEAWQGARADPKGQTR